MCKCISSNANDNPEVEDETVLNHFLILLEQKQIEKEHTLNRRLPPSATRRIPPTPAGLSTRTARVPTRTNWVPAATTRYHYHSFHHLYQQPVCL